MKKRGGKSFDSSRMFIPNVWLPVTLGSNREIEHSIRSAYCFKDNIQWFFLVKKQQGFSEFEQVRCGCCKGKLWRDAGFDSGFSASDSPEVLGWLQRHPTKSQTLILVFSLSNLEQIRNALQNHLLKHDFTGTFTELVILEDGRSLMNPLTKTYTRKKLLSLPMLSKVIELKKHRKKSVDKDTLISTMVLKRLNTVKPIKESQQDQQQRQKFSALAKEALKSLQNVITFPNNSEAYKRFKANQAELNLQLPMIDLMNVWKNLDQQAINSTPKLESAPLRRFISQNLLRPQEENVLLKLEKLIERKRLSAERRENGMGVRKKMDSTFYRSL